MDGMEIIHIIYSKYCNLSNSSTFCNMILKSVLQLCYACIMDGDNCLSRTTFNTTGQTSLV